MLAAAALAGCAGGRLKEGRTTAETVVIEAVGRVPDAGTRAEVSLRATAAAEREAVSRMLELYIASATRTAASGVIEDRILTKTTDYIGASTEVDSRREGPFWLTRIRAEMRYLKLGQDLEDLGLVNVQAPEGQPRVSVSIGESGPGALMDNGRASQALRRALILRGYAAADLSDRLSSSFKDLGDPVKSEAAASAAHASVLVVGSAEARSRADDRLAGYFASVARVKVSCKALRSPAWALSFEQEASAIDLAAESASAKALENAGMLAGERIAEALAPRLKGRSEIAVVIEGASGISQAVDLIRELRGIPEISAVALGALAPKRLNLKVFSAHSGDDVAGALMRASNFSLRVVVVDANYVEMETASGAGLAD